MLNPRTPFIYREAEEMEPFVYARYGACFLSASKKRVRWSIYCWFAMLGDVMMGLVDVCLGFVDWGVEKQVFVQDKTDKEILDILKGLVEHGFTLPKSPESDILVAAPIIEADKGEDAYEPINLTWDGVTLRRNPDFDIPLEEAVKEDAHP